MMQYSTNNETMKYKYLTVKYQGKRLGGNAQKYLLVHNNLTVNHSFHIHFVAKPTDTVKSTSQVSVCQHQQSNSLTLSIQS